VRPTINIKLNKTMSFSCPVPVTSSEKITLAHGSGGTVMHNLIQNVFINELGNTLLNQGHDGAIFELSGQLAFTTDSFVVDPIFFPGGNIGDLAVNGTVNDLACCGAIPKYLSLGLILEEGFEIEELKMVVKSIKLNCEKAGVQVVTGDTKVVEKGKGDKIFINTSGVGLINKGIHIHPTNCKPGDKIIINGGIAEHGIAIISSREGLSFETTIKSDTAPLNKMVEEVLKVCTEVKVMRDPTRGGISSTMNEIVSTAKCGALLYEDKIPILEEVKAACEILGFDPLYVANEGKILFVVPESKAQIVLDKIREMPYGENASIIGEIVEDTSCKLKLKTIIGSTRIVNMIAGEQLPRIC
jgi:hydrogenase expression/formation protein HypE